jgi:hypothetical protein
MVKKQQFKIVIRYKSSITGYFVTEEYARNNPKTTYRVTFKIPINP